MKLPIFTITLLLSLNSVAEENSGSDRSSLCEYDRLSMLNMDYKSFDQTTGSGWRKLSKKGCYIDAADLIRDYRLKNNYDSKLIFHEAQQRAFGKQTKEAIDLFKKTYIPKDENDPLGFNLYVKATIEFLNRDKTSLVSTADKYFELPKPNSLKLVDENGKPVKMSWPVNKLVVERLVNCFGKSYRVAYKEGCKKD